jgi:nitrite reductase/ring-hydroxylating ferredoxin subunit/uncharacterized membrane protein
VAHEPGPRAERIATTTPPDNRSGLDRWIDGQGWLDGLADTVQGWVNAVFKIPGGQWLEDVLHGSKPLGHPLHPALTDIPLGAFAVMFLADWLSLFTRVIPGSVGTFALIVGILAMLAAAVTGLADYTETFGSERRWASAHALTMITVLVAMVVSLILRYQPSATLFFWGIVVSSLAFFLSLFGGFLGGHLSFGFATMVNHDAWLEGTTDWTAVGSVRDFPKDTLVRKQAGDMPVLLVRLGDRIHAISAQCSHAGGPLDEGTLEGSRVTCPWHGSIFSIETGRVVGGPATFDEPRFEVRESDGRVELRLAAPLH